MMLINDDYCTLESIGVQKTHNSTIKESSSIVEHGRPLLCEISKNIVKWAEHRKLIPGSPDKQFLKLVEESGELASAMLKNDSDKIIDSIGDCLVVLIILSKQLNLSAEQCLEHAWNEIKNRTGKTINGTFIKD